MGSREMGRHRSTEEGREVSTVREIERLKKEISKMRPTCKSHTDDKLAKGECCQTKKSSGKHRSKPTNVATFAKRKKMAFGGMV